MKTGSIGKSNTNNLPAPTELTENLYGKKKLFFKDATQKSASMVVSGIAIELQPWSPIFEKCSHLREKGELMGNSLSRTVYRGEHQAPSAAADFIPCSSPSARIFVVGKTSALYLYTIERCRSSRSSPRAEIAPIYIPLILVWARW
jgi:hypothetical protein